MEPVLYLECRMGFFAVYYAKAREGTKSMENRNNLSAGDVPGSGRFGYPQGTTNDERHEQRQRRRQEIATSGTTRIYVSLPFSSRSCGICLTAGIGNFMALSMKEELEHAKEKHGDLPVVFKCSKCGKEYLKKHAAECHIPKCSGPPAVQEVLPYVCTLCSGAYKTKTGLSQHERHSYPEVRNAARVENAVRPRPGGSTSQRQLVFSEAEIKRMLELEIELQGDRLIAAKMSKELGSKTAKQIRDKRCEKGYLRRRAELFAQLQPEIEENIPSALESNMLDPLEESEEEILAWRASVKRVTSEASLPENTKNEALIALFGKLKEAVSFVCDGEEMSPQTIVDSCYDEVVKYILRAPIRNKKGTRSKKDKENSSPPVSRTNSRRSRRQYAYARTQEIFRENPGILAKHVRDGTNYLEGEKAAVSPSAADVQQFYTRLWSETSHISLPKAEREEQIFIADVLPPFRVTEIESRIKRFRPNVSAGADEIKRAQIQGRSVPVVLQLFFNLVLLCGVQPSAWRTNRTTLLLKEGKDGSDIRNYRPITISSIISRLYWGLIDERLRQCVSLTPRQKGFTSESGCFNNVHIFNEILKTSKGKDGLVAVQLDITKAFDTVPHESIKWALRRKGLPETAVRHMVDSYKDMYTVIGKGPENSRIRLNRGIKQGDPLSPFIFNLVFEPLLLGLEKLTGFRVNESTCISSLAFADDLLLTATNKEDAVSLLRYTEEFLRGLGMELAAQKCMCFHIKKTKDSWCILNPNIKLIGGEEIPFADEESRLEYLGIKISPWAGINPVDVRDALYTSCQRVMRLPLKPQQKIQLISMYLVPHYLYALVIAVPPMTLVREMDQELRVVCKDILHLPHSTADGLLYCPRKHGGIGFPKLEIVVASATLKTGLKFIESSDPVQQALVESSGMLQRLKRIANAVRLNWPASLREVENYKTRAKNEELKRWANLRSQGKAVNSLIDDKIGNAWLYNTKLLKPCRFITALKLRTNVAANKVSLNRARQENNVNCRQCRGQLETLAHILGQCTFTKSARMERHNQIRDLVLDEVVRNNPDIAASKEPSLRLPSGEVLKPDLVLQSQKGVLVVDVTVRHEDGDYLEKGRAEKITKYTPLLPILQQRFQKEDAEVLPIVVGTRGAMPKETVRALEKLNIIDRKTLVTISLMSLRSSIEIYHQFMDYNAPRRVNSEMLD